MKRISSRQFEGAGEGQGRSGGAQVQLIQVDGQRAQPAGVQRTFDGNIVHESGDVDRTVLDRKPRFVGRHRQPERAFNFPGREFENGIARQR